jgi:hypothetical protein
MKKILRFLSQHRSGSIKKTIFFSILLITARYSQAQNVGIGTSAPFEKLDVKGNLFIRQESVQSSSSPDAAHTFPITGEMTLSVYDSVYRFYDPGGTGNYAPNTVAGLIMLDSAFTGGEQIGGLEINFELIDLGVGDSLYVYDMISFRRILICGGDCNTAPYPSFSGIGLGIEFRSNSDGNVGQGFSVIVRRVFPKPTTAGNNLFAKYYGNSSLLFDAGKGALKAGIGTHDELGIGAVSLGLATIAKERGTVAIGFGSKAYGLYDVALGRGFAHGGDAFAIGGSASSPSSIAIGISSSASATGAVALGTTARADGDNSVSIGSQSIAFGSKSFALGGGRTQPNSNNSLAFGELSNTTGNYSIALGKSATTNGTSAVAIGEGASASGNNALALGQSASVLGVLGVAIGRNATAGPLSTAIGYSTGAFGTNTFAIGNAVNSSGNHSIAVGNNSSASANNSFALGNNVTANGNYSIALGSYVSTSGFEGALTIGDRSTTTTMNTFVENGMRCRFANGYRFFTNSAANIGAFLNANANSWAALSDVRLKENFLPVNGEDILKKIGGMPQYTWNYKGQDVKTLRHYGPMAQDFYKAFGKDGLGEIGCDTLINQQDFLGVSFIAIQALEKRTADLLKENEALKATLQQQALDFKQEADDLKSRLEKLEKAFAAKQ